MAVRILRSSDQSELQALARQLWPEDTPYDFEGEHVFVWECEDGVLGGFATMSIRPWVDGSDGAPCPHLEGWYVLPELRRKGVGRALVAAIESWCASHNFREFTSDTLLENEVSIRAHAALGFEPTEQIQHFKKRIAQRT